jgi:hypothetical protein
VRILPEQILPERLNVAKRMEQMPERLNAAERLAQILLERLNAAPAAVVERLSPKRLK